MLFAVEINSKHTSQDAAMKSQPTIPYGKYSKQVICIKRKVSNDMHQPCAYKPEHQHVDDYVNCLVFVEVLYLMCVLR